MNYFFSQENINFLGNLPLEVLNTRSGYSRLHLQINLLQIQRGHHILHVKSDFALAIRRVQIQENPRQRPLDPSSHFDSAFTVRFLALRLVLRGRLADGANTHRLLVNRGCSDGCGRSLQILGWLQLKFHPRRLPFAFAQFCEQLQHFDHEANLGGRQVDLQKGRVKVHAETQGGLGARYPDGAGGSDRVQEWFLGLAQNCITT